MSSDQTLLELPQSAIKRTVDQAVAKIYGSQEVPIRVVRQHRALKLGSLQFIDYAIPCFELARTVQLQPDLVAHALVDELAAHPTSQDSDNSAYWKYEAVSGYINIQLSDGYIQEVVKTAGHWLHNPGAYKDEDFKDAFLITDIGIDETSKNGELYNKAYQYIHEVYELLQEAQTAAYLLNDFSERLPHHLSQTIHQTASQSLSGMRKHAQTHQAARRFMVDSPAVEENDPIKQEFGRLQAALIAKCKKLLQERDITNYELIQESAIIAETDTSIDALQGKLGKGEFVKDEASRAVYYAQTDTVVALRSAEGMLYSTSYILHALEAQLLQSPQTATRTVVVLAPNKLQQLITDYAGMLIAEHKLNAKLVYFDAQVARADILQLESAVPSVKQHFKALGDVLSGANQQWFADVKTRQATLSFVDLPETLSKAIADVQLPAFFDIISESVKY